MAPINLPDGSQVSEIVLPDGSTASEVLAPDGSRVFSSIPDSAIALYDAQALAGFSDGDAVSIWDDEVGSFDANAPSGGESAVYRDSAINGYPALEFDGVDGRYRASGLDRNQPNTVFAVVDYTGSAGTRNYVVDGDADRNLLRYDINDQWGIFAGNEIYGSGDASIQLLSARFDGANSVLRETGTQTLAGDAGSQGIDDLIIGAQAGGGNEWDGYIGEIVVCDEGLSDSEISSEEQRLADKWGITL